MGPVVDEQLERWTLRPFQSSTTFGLLRDNPDCVFHVCDQVLPIVKMVLGMPHELECHRTESGVWVIHSACHWYHLRVDQWNVASERSEAIATVQARGTQRPFWGWNRAKHAVIEATILTSRVHLLGVETVQVEMEKMRTIIVKTAGEEERAAWQLLETHLNTSGSATTR